MGSGLDLGNTLKKTLYFHCAAGGINLALILQKEGLIFSQDHISESLVQVSVVSSGTGQNQRAYSVRENENPALAGGIEDYFY